MGAAASCTGKFDIVTEEEIQAAIKSIKEWEDTQKAGQKAVQALRTVRKDSFKRAANELNQKGGIVERIGGADRVHDVIQVFYRKLFANPEIRHFFMNLPSDRMRAKQMKFMRYMVGGPITYGGNLRCVHAALVSEQGLDLAKFQVLQALLTATLRELMVPQDVVDDINANVEAAKVAIFTPTADELVSSEEMTAAAEALGHPLVDRLGGPHEVQVITQGFYRKLFRSEELKYFFVSMNAERLRNMQFKFMRYLFAGPSSYSRTGGNMRCVHARMVKEDGLDLPKFNMVIQMLVDVMEEQGVSKANMREVLANVEAAKVAIFTPTPDELVSREELVAEAESLMAASWGAAAVGDAGGGQGGAEVGDGGGGSGGDGGGEGGGGGGGGGGRDQHLVERLGGPGAVYELIHNFYVRLFNDEELKYYFVLSEERLRSKQFKFMRYLLGGPPAYTGDLRCVHASLIRDRGLNGPRFDRMVSLLTAALTEVAVPPDVAADLMRNVEAARMAIFGEGEGGGGGGGGAAGVGSRPASAASATAAAAAAAGAAAVPGGADRVSSRPVSGSRSAATADGAAAAAASPTGAGAAATTVSAAASAAAAAVTGSLAAPVAAGGGSRPASALSGGGGGSSHSSLRGDDGTARRAASVPPPAASGAPTAGGCPFARSLSHADEAQLDQILAAVAAAAAAMTGPTSAAATAVVAGGGGGDGSRDVLGGSASRGSLASGSASSCPGATGFLGHEEEALLDAIMEAPGVTAPAPVRAVVKA